MPVPSAKLQAKNTAPISFGDLNEEFRGSRYLTLSMKDLRYGGDIICSNKCTDQIRGNSSSPYYANIGLLPAYNGTGSNMRMNQFYSKWSYSANPTGTLYLDSGDAQLGYDFSSFYNSAREYNQNINKRNVNPLFVEIINNSVCYSNTNNSQWAATIPNEASKGGTIVYLDNNGGIYGAAGDGGNGGTGGYTKTNREGASGSNASHALQATCERLYLDNDGAIYGGGGGGGGGGGSHINYNEGWWAWHDTNAGNGGGGGGGGQGYNGFATKLVSSTVQPFLHVVNSDKDNPLVYLTASGTGSANITLSFEMALNTALSVLTIRSNHRDIVLAVINTPHPRKDVVVNISASKLYKFSFSSFAANRLWKDISYDGALHTTITPIPKNTIVDVNGIGFTKNGNVCSNRLYIKNIVSQDQIAVIDTSTIKGGAPGGGGGKGQNFGCVGDAGEEGRFAKYGNGGSGKSCGGSFGHNPGASGDGGNGGGWGSKGDDGGSGGGDTTNGGGTGGAGGTAIDATTITYVKKGSTAGSTSAETPF